MEAGECQCGNPYEKCATHGTVWYPQRIVCFAAMEQAAAQRRWDELHKERPFHDGTFTSWSDREDDEHPFRYDDGVRIVVVPDEDPTPDDEFLVEESAGLPQQAVGEQAEAAEQPDDEN